MEIVTKPLIIVYREDENEKIKCTIWPPEDHDFRHYAAQARRFQAAIAEIVARHKNQGARIEIIYLANELQRRASEGGQ